MKKIIFLLSFLLIGLTVSYAHTKTLTSTNKVALVKGKEFKTIAHSVTYKTIKFGTNEFKPAYSASITLTSADGRVSLTVTATSDVSLMDALNKAYTVASLALKLSGNN